MTAELLAFDELARAIAGEVITPDHPGYDEARGVWNGLFYRRPSAVVRCTSAEDVSATLQYLDRTGTPFVVRSGGHSTSGLSSIDDGVVIDLSPLKGVTIDVENRTARAQAGLLGGELDVAVQEHGLATTLGTIAHTGIAGLTLGGGMGYLMRKYGLAADNVLSYQAVLADGTITRVDADHEPDLFWALRGGGGQFAVVTEFEYQLYPVGPIVTASFTGFGIDNPLPALKKARDLVKGSPRERDVMMAFGQLKGAPGIPPEIDGKPGFIVFGFSADPADADGAWLHPLREHSPLFASEAQMPYTVVQQMFDENSPHGALHFSKGAFIRELTDEALEAYVEATTDAPVDKMNIFLYLQQMGGRVSEIGFDESPVSGRAADFVLNLATSWTDPSAQELAVAWSRQFIAKMEPFGLGAPPLNFEGDTFNADSTATGTDIYLAEAESRLEAVKAKYDPKNRFAHVRLR